MDIQYGLFGTRRRRNGLKGLVILLLAVIMLTGCSYIEKKSNYQPPLEIATEQSEYIMECVVNKDKEGLKSIFSKHVAETHDLDKEIDEFFEFIDGDIISYDEPEGNEGGYTRRDGEYTEKELTGVIRNIQTDKGKIYSIGYRSYYIYKSNEDYVGIQIINIRDENTRVEYDTYSEVEQCSIGGME